MRGQTSQAMPHTEYRIELSFILPALRWEEMSIAPTFLSSAAMPILI